MKGLDAAVAKYPFIDGTRLAAAGGSYGGYMMDWIATHTGRFKCLISHAGPYDEVGMYGATEELWFMDWEFGGHAVGESQSFIQDGRPANTRARSENSRLRRS